MITQVGNRKATQDIDVVIATNDRHTYQAVQQAIALVAKEKKLPPAWLNDDVRLRGTNRKIKSTETVENLRQSHRYVPNWSIFSHSSFLRGVLKMIATSRQ